MFDDYGNETKEYMNYLDNFSEERKTNFYDNTVSSNKRKSSAEKTSLKTYNNNNRRRKGLKWKLIGLYHSKTARIVLGGLLIFVIVMIIVSSCGKKEAAKASAVKAKTAATQITSYKIKGVPVIPQGELHAACETYACTMLLQSYKFDIDEIKFADDFLVTKPVYYGADGNMYGPDMNSAYAGDIYTGYGINAPGMAKCMNNYIKTTKSKLKAYPILNVPLKTLCKEYILKDVPVMVWATTYMDEPYVKASWIVDYVDENAKFKVGDTVSWQMHEHCMVLIGFDSDNYYFCDSVSGKVSAYDITTSEKRYEQIGKQAIVLK